MDIPHDQETILAPRCHHLQGVGGVLVSCILRAGSRAMNDLLAGSQSIRCNPGAATVLYVTVIKQDRSPCRGGMEPDLRFSLTTFPPTFYVLKLFQEPEL